MLTLVVAAVVAVTLSARSHRTRLRRASSPWRTWTSTAAQGGRFQPKPPWVQKEVIRLKALMPQAGCRTISLTFNRLHAAKSKQPMSIGKTYIAEVLKRGQMEVMQARRQMRRRKPRATERNRIWALDLTYAGRVTASPLCFLS